MRPCSLPVLQPTANDTLYLSMVDTSVSPAATYVLGYYNVKSFKGWNTGAGTTTLPLYHPRK